MKITVTFTGHDGPIPDGSSIVFENAGNIRLSMLNDLERIGCDVAGCAGCSFTHRRLTGVHHLKLKATGTDGNRPLWESAGRGPS